MRPCLYIELGIYRAELFNKVVPFAGTAVGVDTDPRARSHVRKAANARFVLGTTDDLVEELREQDARISMLFIDADHSCESVLRDFRNYLPLVADHGLILMHDTHPGDEQLTQPGWCGDAYRAVQELQAEGEGYEMMTIPRSPGLTICRKRDAQLSWMEPHEIA
ncbi:MAG: class I SAM-dependent methyltransferase [Coriobacteriia bacterium]|nr:class I SAM-dependent methyltransferase [Coriobacteriia bacterium]